MDFELIVGLIILVLCVLVWMYDYTHQKPHWKQVARDKVNGKKR